MHPVQEGVQTEIVHLTFKLLVTRLVGEAAILARPENSSLHTEMRNFLSYIHQVDLNIALKTISGLCRHTAARSGGWWCRACCSPSPGWRPTTG